jgi:hypothetical protein
MNGNKSHTGRPAPSFFRNEDHSHETSSLLLAAVLAATLAASPLVAAPTIASSGGSRVSPLPGGSGAPKYTAVCYDDFTSSARMQTVQGAELNFPGATVTQFLQASHVSAYDYSTSGKFSIEFWRNPTWRGFTAGSGTNHCWVSKDQSVGKGFTIRSYGVTGQEDQVEIFLWGNTGGANGSNSFRTTQNPPNGQPISASNPHLWSVCHVTFNASTQTLTVYLDGVKIGQVVNATASGSMTVESGAVPSATPVNSQPLTLGATDFGASGMLDKYIGALSSAKLWVGRELSQSDVTSLTGNYFPTPYASLANQVGGPSPLLTNCVGAWELTEATGSGNRADATANNNPMVPKNWTSGNSSTAVTGSVPQAVLCQTYRELGALQLTKKAISFQYMPHYAAKSLADGTSAAPFNGSPSLYFGGQHGLHALVDGVGQWCQSADFCCAFQPTAVSFGGTADSIDRHLIGVATRNTNTGDNDRQYFFLDLFGTNVSGFEPVPHMRIKPSASFNLDNRPASASSNLGSVGGVNNFVIYRVLGAGGTASYSVRVNGVADTIDPNYAHGAGDPNSWGTNSGYWNTNLSQCASLNVVSVGALNYLDAIDSITSGNSTVVPGDNSQDYFRGYVAMAAIYGAQGTGGALGNGDINNLENKWRAVTGK